MGTRCVTVVHDQDGAPLMAMYRQFDGYPEGHGQELAEFVSARVIGNGISMGAKPGSFANGMGCLAAQIVAHFKAPHPLGGFYLIEPGSKLGDWGSEYLYAVHFDGAGKPARIEVQGG